MTAALLLTACLGAPPAVASAEPDAALNALFRPRTGWVGGDGGFSAVLPSGRALWLFSDTFVGEVRDGKRCEVAMVNNTVGAQDGRRERAKVAFFVARDKDKPTALFVPPEGAKTWFWIFAGHASGDQLHVFLPRFEKADGPAAFGFKALDVWLGTVSNPTDEPTKWKTTYAKVPFAEFGEKRKVTFGSAVLTVGEFAYVYGYEETPSKVFPSRKLLTARVPKDKLARFDAWRFWSKGGWVSDPKDATPQAGAVGAEFSVTYVPGLKQYALVTTENGLSERVVARFAEKPEGPWGEPVLLYTCPEMKRDKKLFTYAGKAHPHLAGDNELVLSYATNSFDFARTINDASVYWPSFVRVKLK